VRILFGLLLSMMLVLVPSAVALCPETPDGLEVVAAPDAAITSPVVVSAAEVPNLAGNARASPNNRLSVVLAPSVNSNSLTHATVATTSVSNLSPELEAGATHPTSLHSLGFNGFGRVIRI
jgi:hypothetical protein